MRSYEVLLSTSHIHLKTKDREYLEGIQRIKEPMAVNQGQKTQKRRRKVVMLSQRLKVWIPGWLLCQDTESLAFRVLTIQSRKCVVQSLKWKWFFFYFTGPGQFDIAYFSVHKHKTYIYMHWGITLFFFLIWPVVFGSTVGL